VRGRALGMRLKIRGARTVMRGGQRKEMLMVHGWPREWAWKGDIHGPIETLTKKLCEGGFLQSFREQVRDSHDFLRQKSSSPFILVLLGLNSVTSLLIVIVREVTEFQLNNMNMKGGFYLVNSWKLFTYSRKDRTKLSHRIL
jgi:hypothetical protein